MQSTRSLPHRLGHQLGRYAILALTLVVYLALVVLVLTALYHGPFLALMPVGAGGAAVFYAAPLILASVYLAVWLAAVVTKWLYRRLAGHPLALAAVRPCGVLLLGAVLLVGGCTEANYSLQRLLIGADCRPGHLTNDGQCTPLK